MFALSVHGLKKMGDPDFLPRGATSVRVCGFHQGKPHGVRQRPKGLQEIRGKPFDCFD
jgi:hypothetical protein